MHFQFKHKSIAVILLSAVAVGGVASARDGSAPISMLVTSPGASEEIPEDPCYNRQPLQEIVFVINEKGRLLRDLGEDQDIKRNIKKGANDVKTPTNVGSLWPTNLDFRAGNNNPDTNYVPIKILLRPTRKNDTIFLRAKASADPQTDRDSSAAVTVQKGAQSRFCGRSAIDTETIGKKTYEKITFGSILRPGEVTSINIGILIYNNEDESWYPVYIDPNIRNEG